LEKKIYSKAKTEDSSLNFDTMTDNKILYAFVKYFKTELKI
jgi:hypothetical protein